MPLVDVSKSHRWARPCVRAHDSGRQCVGVAADSSARVSMTGSAPGAGVPIDPRPGGRTSGDGTSLVSKNRSARSRSVSSEPSQGRELAVRGRVNPRKIMLTLLFKNGNRRHKLGRLLPPPVRVRTSHQNTPVEGAGSVLVAKKKKKTPAGPGEPNTKIIAPQPSAKDRKLLNQYRSRFTSQSHPAQIRSRHAPHGAAHGTQITPNYADPVTGA